MNRITLIFIGMASFVMPSISHASPDLCDILDTATLQPLYCSPEVSPPSYDDDVCLSLSSGAVVEKTGSYCSRGWYAKHCDFGEVDSAGSVDCYWEPPDLCEETTLCLAAGSAPGTTDTSAICCPGNASPCAPADNTCGADDLFACVGGWMDVDGNVWCDEII